MLHSTLPLPTPTEQPVYAFFHWITVHIVVSVYVCVCVYVYVWIYIYMLSSSESSFGEKTTFRRHTLCATWTNEILSSSLTILPFGSLFFSYYLPFFTSTLSKFLKLCSSVPHLLNGHNSAYSVGLLPLLNKCCPIICWHSVNSM